MQHFKSQIYYGRHSMEEIYVKIQRRNGTELAVILEDHKWALKVKLMDGSEIFISKTLICK